MLRVPGLVPQQQSMSVKYSMNAAAIKTQSIQFIIQTAADMWADVTPKETVRGATAPVLLSFTDLSIMHMKHKPT